MSCIGERQGVLLEVEDAVKERDEFLGTRALVQKGVGTLNAIPCGCMDKRLTPQGCLHVRHEQ